MKETGRTSRRAGGRTVIRSFVEFEARYFPAHHKRRQVEENRQHPAKYGTGIVGELMDNAIGAAKRG